MADYLNDFRSRFGSGGMGGAPGGGGPIQPFSSRAGQPFGGMIPPLGSRTAILPDKPTLPGGDFGNSLGAPVDQSTLKKIGKWITDNPEVALGALGLVGDYFHGRSQDKGEAAAIAASEADTKLRRQKADELGGMVGGIQYAPTDLSPLFADPSNPFYKGRVKPLGG